MEVLCFLPSTHYPLYDFDLRATHARTLLPAALASVPFGFVLVRVRTSRRDCVLVRVSRFRSTRQFSELFFCPSRASSQCCSQASGVSRSQHRLSYFLLTKYGSRGCNAVGCANTNEHRPTNTRSCFSAPEAVGRTKIRLCSGSDSHVSEFGGGVLPPS